MASCLRKTGLKTVILLMFWELKAKGWCYIFDTEPIVIFLRHIYRELVRWPFFADFRLVGVVQWIRKKPSPSWRELSL